MPAALCATAFVSYARKDSKVALKLAGDLAAEHVDVWLDQADILAGEHWDPAVEAALERCTHVIVILSPASVASKNVLDEVSYAVDEKKHIVPVLVEHCKRPLRLRRLQFIDFTGDYAAGLEKLLSLLKVAPHSGRQRPGRATTPVPDPYTGPRGAGAAAADALTVKTKLSPPDSEERELVWGSRIFHVGDKVRIVSVKTTTPLPTPLPLTLNPEGTTDSLYAEIGKTGTVVAIRTLHGPTWNPVKRKILAVRWDVQAWMMIPPGSWYWAKGQITAMKPFVANIDPEHLEVVA